MQREFKYGKGRLPLGKMIENAVFVLSPVEWAEYFPQGEMGKRLAKWRISMSREERG